MTEPEFETSLCRSRSPLIRRSYLIGHTDDKIKSKMQHKSKSALKYAENAIERLSATAILFFINFNK